MAAMTPLKGGERTAGGNRTRTAARGRDNNGGVSGEACCGISGRARGAIASILRLAALMGWASRRHEVARRVTHVVCGPSCLAQRMAQSIST